MADDTPTQQEVLENFLNRLLTTTRTEASGEPVIVPPEMTDPREMRSIFNLTASSRIAGLPYALGRLRDVKNELFREGRLQTMRTEHLIAVGRFLQDDIDRNLELAEKLANQAPVIPDSTKK